MCVECTESQGMTLYPNAIFKVLTKSVYVAVYIHTSVHPSELQV